MTFLIILFSILMLVGLVTWGKINAFIAFIIVSLMAGLLLGIPLESVAKSVSKGVGDTIGGIICIIVFGAMLGKLVAESGAAQRIATVIMDLFGRKYVQAAMVITGFVIGIPLFYNVGFVLMIPLIFSVVSKYKIPPVYIGLPMLSSLSVMHGFLPPHPSPTVLVTQFHANMGLTFLYGIILAVPVIIIAGPLYTRTLKNIVSVPLKSFYTDDIPEERLPGAFNSFFSSLLPVVLLMAVTALQFLLPGVKGISSLLTFLSEPSVIMLLALLVATFTLGVSGGRSMKEVMAVYGESLKDIIIILLIIGGSGALKQVFVDSGVNAEIATALRDLHVHPLILGWLIAALIRVCLGSATIAGLTTAGIMLPVLAASGTDPNLMVLAIGAGSLMFSHVNDPGFWMFKEYFNISVKDTLRSWSMMETLVSLGGIAGVMLLNMVIH
ncbi:gluconate:H+ symporter [Hufsiella ginkgonis]|uniref:Gluconate transporter n=1 Tax=Hufsiella ginkgonis TaxID=2695274 RepID=A0A7K1XZ74_9SPHI|nr:gluconate:H+ symporter [Hufsiella ginkgonis]MXV16118.1 gluconate transporter [Hufsiella ginkgonis]